MGRFGEELTTILLATVSLAALAVLVSRNAQTGTVLTSFGTAWGGILNAATSPVTGGGLGGIGSMPQMPQVPSFGG